MTDEQQEKMNQSHRYFSSNYFNATWDILDKAQKTEEDIEKMIHLAHASFWHWTEVPEHTLTNLSIGYWQLSRVYAVAGKGEEALYYGEKCLDVSLKNQLDPFYIGYGYEAIARACHMLKKVQLAEENKEKAVNFCEKVSEEENKALLEADIKSL